MTWKKQTLIAISLCICLLFNVQSGADTRQVSQIIDGDTFILESGEKVRLIGVDCPESQDPNKPVEYFADQSKEYLRRLIEGKEVRLEYGDERTDKYGRLLCYVWVDDSILVNREIIKKGYGMAYLRFSHEREQEFLDAELQARRSAIGMWASPRSGQPLLEIKDECDTTSTCYQLGLAQGKLLAIELARQMIQSGQVTTKTTTPQVTPDQDDETVYITRTGSKYHRGTCGYLRKSKIPISKKEAIERGYTPCSKCRP